MTYEEAIRTIPPGRYRHFKGRLYEVVGIARHSETEEAMVVYQALCGDGSMKRRAKDELYLAIALKESGKVIGEIFAHPEGTDPEDEVMDTFSPCWMLNLNYTGKGYAYEAAHAYFDDLFREKGARRIYAYTEDYNIPSQHLCERLGMRREGLFIEFVSFVNNPGGTPLYENTMQYAIL